MYSLRSIGVLSCAKMMGAFYACTGLLVIPMMLVAIVAGAASQQGFSALGAVGLLTMALFMPVFYGLFGFLAGALGAWLYNEIARRLGGIRIEIKEANDVTPTKGIGLI
jgi:Na+/H+-dicarboxylate symporter